MKLKDEGDGMKTLRFEEITQFMQITGLMLTLKI